jgi:hypothetical protein
MLRKLTIAIALTTLIAGSVYAGALPKTGINGSLHDMNMWSGMSGFNKDIYGRSCVYCHTPHNAGQLSQTSFDNARPLWNRQETNWSGSSYGWTGPGNTGSLSGRPDDINPKIAFNTDPLVGPSRLCLSCHDGSIAADSHGSQGNANNGTQIGGFFMTGGRGHIDDLTVTHPIGFKYADAVAVRNTAGVVELAPATDGFIDAPSAQLTGSNFDTETSRPGLTKSSTKIADTLYKGYMTCATCHDVHNTTNAAPDTAKVGYNYLLRARQEGSALCISCHVK